MNREEKNQITRRKILDSAIEEFAQHGPEAASINTICQNGGVSKGIIYHYFESKDRLYLACLEECFEALTDDLKRNIGSRTVSDLPDLYFQSRQIFFEHYPAYARIFCYVILFPLERLRTEIQKIRKNYDDLNDLYLHHILEQKALRSDLSEEEILRSFHCLQDFLNARIAGHSYSAVFSNMISPMQLQEVTEWFHPILGISLLASIVDLGAPLDFHLILGAGFFTVVYIVSRGLGKYFGARAGAKATHMPETVQKYLGLTLLPHSGVSLVFTGIVCGVLADPRPELAALVKGTIAAAAVINEIIAVLAAREGFELAGEIGFGLPDQKMHE